MPDSTDHELASSFLAFARTRMIGQNWPNLRTCVESLTDEQIWSRPNEVSNSVGNLVLHLNGNLGQLFLTIFTGAKDTRDRPREFHAIEQPSGAELLRRLAPTMEAVDQLLARLTPEDLLRSYNVSGKQMRGIDLIFRIVEHFGLHYGQIIYITKALTGRDLGFYVEPAKTSPAR
jgi:uncharacterized damage-inducible protein DinB